MIKVISKIVNDETNDVILDSIESKVMINAAPYYKGERYVDCYAKINFSIAEPAFEKTGIQDLLNRVDKEFRSE